MTEPISLGVLGAERAAWLLSKGCLGRAAELTCVCETESSICGSFAPTLRAQGIKCLRDFDELLGAKPDAVYIAGPPDERALRSIKALRSGLSVLCEPPIAMSLDEAYRLERAVRESGRLFALAELRCFERGVMLARRIIRRGGIGRVVYAEAEEITQIPRRAGLGSGDRRAVRLPTSMNCTGSVGPLLLATGLRAVSVSGAETGRLSPTAQRLSSAAVELLMLSGGAPGRALHGRLCGRGGMELRVFGETGSLEVNGGRLLLHEFGSGAVKSSLQKSEGILLPGMTGGYRSERDYAAALCIAGFAAKLAGDVSAYCIEVYRALDMALPGLIAYRSQLDGGRPIAVPDLRGEEGRAVCRGDRSSPVPDDDRYRLML